MNPEQWLSLKWNGGSTMSDRWLNQSKIIQSVCQKGFLIFRDYCKRAIRATQKTILGSFGIDEADAKARALAIGKELMYAEEPEKEEDEYGTFWLE